MDRQFKAAKSDPIGRSAGLTNASGAAVRNNMRHEIIMVKCLRNKGHYVY